MSYIFLSHSSADELEAVALKQWLLDNGWDDVFLDLDPERGLKAGESWQEGLRRATDRCEAVIFVISPAWAESRWCLAEFLLAKSLHKLIFGVVVKDTSLSELPSELTSEYQLCNLTGDGSTAIVHFTRREMTAQVAFLTDGLNRLKLGLQTAGLSASFFPWPPPGDKLRAPYRGLEPLDAPDAAIFFGRDVEIVEGLDKLRGMRTAGNEGLFVILGASGAGKSSFLRAGLLPRLARDDRHFYLLDVIRPERNPLFGELGLVQAISKANNQLRLKPVNIGEIKAALREGAERFRQLLSNIQNAARNRSVGLPDDAPHPTLLLSIDQVEELFSADATEEARIFLTLIGDALRATLPRGGAQSLSVIIAFTIRSDRYEPLQTAPELMGLKTVVFDALKPMPKVQFKEVITGPAVRASLSGRRLEIKPDLVQQLLDDCDQGGDTLPLLSLTLARLYREYGSDGDLSLAEYLGMGGMTNVIRTEIESVLSADPKIRTIQLEILHSAFIPWLATVNPDNDQPVRRLTRMSDLPPASHPLVQALIDRRLLLSDLRDGERVVEVAHESVLRQWETLAAWLREEREDLKEADRLEHAVATWNRSGKKADWLVRGERLAISETLSTKPGYYYRLQSASEYLLCSRQYETERKEAEERHRQAELVIAQEKQRSAQEKQAAAEALAAEQGRAARRAQEDAISLEKRAKQLEAEKKRVQLALAQADFREAQRHYRENNLTHALAFLAHAARLDTEGVAGRALLANLLQQRRWALPVAILKHRAIVRSAQFSPDGTRVVTASDDNTARLWDAKTGEPLGEPMIHPGAVSSTHFSPDGMQIVTASDKTARLWDAKTGKPLSEVMVHQTTISSVQFSPGGTLVVTVSSRITQLWDTKTGKPLPVAILKHQGSVRSAQFNPDGTQIVTASLDSTARLWDVKTGKPLGEMMHSRPVWFAQFSPDGAQIVTASLDHSAQLWDAKTGRPLGAAMMHQRAVLSAQFSPDGRQVVTTSFDSTARLWDAKTGEPLGEAMKHQQTVWLARFNPNGACVVTASRDGTARLWDAKTGKPLSEAMTHQGAVLFAEFNSDGTRVVTASEDNTARLWNAKTGKSLPMAIFKHQDTVQSAHFSPNGTRAVTTSADNTARLWDTQTDEFLPVATLKHCAIVRSAQFSPDGTRLVTVSDDHTARLWNAKTAEPLGEPMMHQGPVRSAQFNLQKATIVTASEDRAARIWDTQTGRLLGEPLMHHESVWSARFSPDGTRVVTASNDNTVRLWDAKTGKPLGDAMTHQGTVSSARFSPDGTSVMTLSNHTARLWDAKTGKPLGHAIMDQGVVWSLRFSPDGTQIVATSKDDIVRLWDVKTGKRLGEAMMHQSSVWSARFSPDGMQVVTASEDNTARLWDAKTGKPLGDPMAHQGNVSSAQFSPNGTQVMTLSNDKTARLWDVMPVISDKKGLLTALAEVIGGKLSELGAIEPVEDQIEQLDKLRQETMHSSLTEPTAESFIRWFLFNPWTRTISPLSRLTVPEYIQQQIAAGRRDEVEKEFPGHPLLR